MSRCRQLKYFFLCKILSLEVIIFFFNSINVFFPLRSSLVRQSKCYIHAYFSLYTIKNRPGVRKSKWRSLSILLSLSSPISHFECRNFSVGNVVPTVLTAKHHRNRKKFSYEIIANILALWAILFHREFYMPVVHLTFENSIFLLTRRGRDSDGEVRDRKKKVA